MTAIQETAAAFSGLVDLLSERVGGQALLTNDDFFAGMENLVKPGRGVFIPDKYTEQGKWMDGWESRRKRVPGYDWCILKLGLSGQIHGVDIDTNHFLGNHPPYASIEACCIDGDPSPEALEKSDQWVEILERVPLRAGSQNLFAVASRDRWTHVRLNIFPDGGVARLKVYGDVVPDWDGYRSDELIDLGAIQNGAHVVACSDMFFGNKDNLIMPGRSLNMGDGWETKRRRGPGFDWAVVKLGEPGEILKVEVDTNHFKGNYPDRCSLEACYAPHTNIDILNVHEQVWQPLLPETKLQAHTQHYFDSELASPGAVTHVKLNIFPDGGVSRLRLHGIRKLR